MTLGRRLARLRAQRELSQDALAELLGVSRQSVSKWETDTSVPDVDRLVRLSEVFGVSLDELVKGKSPSAAGTPSELPRAGLAPGTWKLHRQKLTGVFLLVAAGLLTLLNPALIFITFLVALLGLGCLLVRCRIALALGWTAWIYGLAVAQPFTSVSMASLLNPGYWRNTAWAAPVLAVVQLAALGFLTWRTFQNPPGLGACWLIWSCLLPAAYLPELLSGGTAIRLLTPEYYHSCTVGAVLLWCHIAVLFWLLRRTWKRRKKRS